MRCCNWQTSMYCSFWVWILAMFKKYILIKKFFQFLKYAYCSWYTYVMIFMRPLNIILCFFVPCLFPLGRYMPKQQTCFSILQPAVRSTLLDLPALGKVLPNPSCLCLSWWLFMAVIGGGGASLKILVRHPPEETLTHRGSNLNPFVQTPAFTLDQEAHL